MPTPRWPRRPTTCVGSPRPERPVRRRGRGRRCAARATGSSRGARASRRPSVRRTRASPTGAVRSRAGARRPRGAGGRAGAGGERRQPHRPHLHRRPVRRLAVRVAAPRRPRRAADLRARGRRPAAHRHPHGRRGPVRAARTTSRPSTERDTCAPWLEREVSLVAGSLRAVVCLGSYGWDAALRTFRAIGYDVPRPKPRFGHAAEADGDRPGRTGGRWCSAATTPRSRTPSPAGSPSRCSTPCWAGPPRRLAMGQWPSPRIPMAEEEALKAFKCGFESHRGHPVPAVGFGEHRQPGDR